MANDNKQKGNYAEAKVAEFYENNGYSVLFRNWRYKNRGEVDVIASLDAEELLIICEVKYRTSQDFGVPSLAVNKLKQKKLRYLTQYFLFQNRNYNKYNIRFDVAEVIPAIENEVTINMIENAF